MVKKILPTLKMVLIGIGILAILFVAYVFIFPEQFDEEESQSLEQTATEQINANESWEELETFYFADADKKGWDTLTITDSQGEDREYEKKNNQWVRKSGNTTQTKTTTNNYPRTEEYRKILLDKILKVYATDENIISLADTALPFMESRIEALNSLISKNDSFADTTSDTFSRKFFQGLNDLYQNDIDYTNNVSKVLTILYKDHAQKATDVLDKDGVIISNATFVTDSEFNRLTKGYDEMMTTAKQDLIKLTKALEEDVAHTEKSDKDYKYWLGLYKERLDSWAEKSHYSSPTNYYPSRSIIPLQQNTTTHCSYSVNPVGGGGNIHCSSY